MQTTNIERFQIINLHGFLNYDFIIEDNRLILVGENGSGKTTILRLLYYVLTGQWLYLTEYKFDEISITVSGKKYSFLYSYIEAYFQFLNKHFSKRFPSRIRKEILDSLKKTTVQDRSGLRNVLDKYGVPMTFVMHELDSIQNEFKNNRTDDFEEFIMNNVNYQVLYLPTYRRIEQELSSILKSSEDKYGEMKFNRFSNTKNSYVELVEFGMKDVEASIGTTLDSLKEFTRENLNKLSLEYLGDVISKKYKEIKIEELTDIDNEMIHNILTRIPESILPGFQKNDLYNTIIKSKSNESLGEHDKVVCHYFLKLFSFQKLLLKKEDNIRNFVKICNSYLVDKYFCYNHEDFSFKITLNISDNVIRLSDLSSGEKQIVSIFSHLFLSGTDNFFVLIDEPELSLSVPWQYKFLQDISAGEFCQGIVAVTHSPFIYDNELNKYGHGINEFAVKGGCNVDD